VIIDSAKQVAKEVEEELCNAELFFKSVGGAWETFKSEYTDIKEIGTG
jgi:hypothetical protein